MRAMGQRVETHECKSIYIQYQIFFNNFIVLGKISLPKSPSEEKEAKRVSYTIETVKGVLLVQSN